MQPLPGAAAPPPLLLLLLLLLLCTACPSLGEPDANATAAAAAAAAAPGLCSRFNLSESLRTGDVAWTRLPDPAASGPLYGHCAVLSARYNCSRFNSTAGHYGLDWRPALRRDPSLRPACELPTTSSLLAALRRDAESDRVAAAAYVAAWPRPEPPPPPLRLLLAGDSHMQQLFQSLLCAFQGEAYEVTTTQNGDPVVVDTMARMPECHSVRQEDHSAFFLDPPGPGAPHCHFAHGFLCFRLRSGPQRDALSDPLVCFMYVRPWNGRQTLEAAFGFAAARGPFTVLGVNTYVDATALGAFLAARPPGAAPLRVVVTTRNPTAGRDVAAPEGEAAGGGGGGGGSGAAAAAAAAGPAIGEAGGPAGCSLTAPVVLARPVALHGGSSLALDGDRRLPSRAHEVLYCASVARAWGVAPDRCSLLDFTRLADARTCDSMATIYPTTADAGPAAGGGAGPAPRRVCHVDQQDATLHPEKCDGAAGVRVCAAAPCAPDSHFCLPGPTDHFALWLLAAARR